MSSTLRPFLEACRGGRPARVPIWIMRQAGRYLPEYREVRSKCSFEALCRTPELAAEVTLQPIRRYDFDASIIFSDILVVSDALGCEFHFPNGGPVTDKPVRSAADIAALAGEASSLDFVGDALRIVRRELPERCSLIGFAGAPLTVAAYMVEGGASKDFARLKGLLYGDPKSFDALLDKVSALTIDYLKAQVAAGADAIQLFDTWAGLLSEADFERHVAPQVARIFAALRELGAPIIYFPKGSPHLLPMIPKLGANVAGLDWSLSINKARKWIGAGDSFPVQGNLDPVTLLCSAEVVRARARALIDQVQERSGYIFNLGHGILKDTDPAVVAALVDEVRKS